MISSIGYILGNLKFLQDVSGTGKLWLQFNGFVSLIRIFIYPERTVNFKLHISSLEQMLLYLDVVGHDKYTVAI